MSRRAVLLGLFAAASVLPAGCWRRGGYLRPAYGGAAGYPAAGPVIPGPVVGEAPGCACSGSVIASSPPFDPARPPAGAVVGAPYGYPGPGAYPVPPGGLPMPQVVKDPPAIMPQAGGTK